MILSIYFLRRDKMKKLITICSIAIMLITVDLIKATTLNVPSITYPTIQSAIDDAVNGDVVIVADGIYTGAGNRDIDFLGKAITVCSENESPWIVLAQRIE
jgi:hypothetical protein